MAAGEYTLLDSGNMQKLEQVGDYRLVRPSPQAIWQPRMRPDAWQNIDALYERNEAGSGKWQWRRKVDRQFEILYDNLAFSIKLTNFGHLGLFPEQATNWGWMREQIRSRMIQTNQANFEVLNLFAYTGGSTLAASQAGAHVTHVDAAKGVVDWARRNAKLCRLDERPIRWLVDDALKFVRREERRQRRYHAIILDPPSFGRGPKGEVFKIENDIGPLLEACRAILARDALFVLYSCHTPGFTPLTLENQLQDLLRDRTGHYASGEMTVADGAGRSLPSGTYARWTANIQTART